MAEVLRIGSLFSGVGGLELGLEWAGVGRTVWQCEIDPKLRACLREHWPESEVYDDVRQLEPARLPVVDLLCGGFPCQDLSPAGKRLGLGGPRSGLWREFYRIASGLRPSWIVVENVAGAARNWVDVIRRDLEQLGYESLPITLAASHVGAWHHRARVFVVAHRDDAKHPRLLVAPDTAREFREGPAARQECAGRAIASRGVAADADDHAGRRQSRQVSSPAVGALAHAHRAREPQQEWPFRSERRRTGDGDWPRWNPWTAEPDLARVVHGLPGRVDRERALGNSVVPQCAQVIGEVIQILRGL